MTQETLQLVLLLVFLMVAMFVLGGALFIRLVELLRSNGSKVEAVQQAVQQVQTHLSNGTARDTSSPTQSDSPTTPE